LTGAPVVPPFTGAPVVPPFTAVPVVPPFTAAPVVPPYVRRPIVATPYAAAAAYGYGFFGGVADDSPVIVVQPEIVQPETRAASAPGMPPAAMPATDPTQPGTPHDPCHPVPSGYHCDWPS
jgi:hypothetical protein